MGCGWIEDGMNGQEWMVETTWEYVIEVDAIMMKTLFRRELILP
jgi:hypothetical protein